MAKTVTQEKLLTFEDVKEWSEDDQAGDLVKGVWVPVTKPTWLHGRLMTRIARILDSFAEAHRLGVVVCGDAGTKLTRDPDTLRGPDVAFVRTERLPEGEVPDEWWEGAPDLAVEIVSNSQDAHDAQVKALEYLSAGAKMLWIVHPKSRTIAVYTPPDHVRILREDETLDGGEVLPGFTCRVSEFFA